MLVWMSSAAGSRVIAAMRASNRYALYLVTANRASGGSQSPRHEWAGGCRLRYRRCQSRSLLRSSVRQYPNPVADRWWLKACKPRSNHLERHGETHHVQRHRKGLTQNTEIRRILDCPRHHETFDSNVPIVVHHRGEVRHEHLCSSGGCLCVVPASFPCDLWG